MTTSLKDLEKIVNSGLSTAVRKSEIKFNQLFIDIKVEDLKSIILFLKTNNKCRFRQLIDITAVDYIEKEQRFKIVYMLLSHENNLRIVIHTDIEEGKASHVTWYSIPYSSSVSSCSWMFEYGQVDQPKNLAKSVTVE